MVPAVRSLLDSLSEGLTVSPAPENQIDAIDDVRL
jgi:hypothetical protein